MARNIEIKARIDNLDAFEERAAALADQGPIVLIQDDTFFSCKSGRLKLRTFPDGVGELIYYRRPDQSGPKESFYVISPTNNPDSLREALSLGYGQIGRVRKRRILYLSGVNRIHLDRVEGLGDFLELEIVLTGDQTTEMGSATARTLLSKLGITEDCLIEGAYLDLLNEARVGGR